MKIVTSLCRHSHSSTYVISDLNNFEKVKKWNNFLKPTRTWKRCETRVAEEYCWAIKQSAGRSYCGWSGSCSFVPVDIAFGQCAGVRISAGLPCTYAADHTCTKCHLEPDMQERNHCVSRGVSVIEILAPRHPRNRLVLAFSLCNQLNGNAQCFKKLRRRLWKA